MLWWIAIISLAAALVTWLLSSVGLRRQTQRDLAKVFFYIFLMAGVIFLLFSLVAEW